MNGPRVLVLDGGSFFSLTVAKELSEDLDAEIVGVGTTRYSRLLRSRYCDFGAVAPPVDDEGYVDAIVDLIEAYRPDVVLPLGYDSRAAIGAARSALPAFVSHCLPPQESFRAAVDKVTVSRYGDRVGIETPREYSSLVEAFDEDGRPAGCLGELDFPVFVKPRWETDDDHATTARVDGPGSFWETYDRAAAGAPNDEVLVQEFVGGSDSTFGCGLCLFDDEVRLSYGHEELRSVPRRGGSGTRLRIHRDPSLEARSIDLLREIGWRGIALVEYKRRADGTYVLMEINPKFWASYALASASGYRFASTVVADALDLPIERPFGSPKRAGEMVFPLRELHFYATHRDEERLAECLATVARPGVSWSVDLTDLRAWLTPPAAVLERLPSVDSAPPDEPLGESPRAVGEPAER